MKENADDFFKIFVHHLAEGQQQKIDEDLPPAFLEMDEPGLTFKKPVAVRGWAEVSDRMLILQLSVQTEVLMPCAICNEDVSIKIDIPGFYHTEKLSSIRTGYFSFKELLREEIILMIPKKVECRLEGCPEREAMAHYLSNKKKEEVTHPFSDL